MCLLYAILTITHIACTGGWLFRKLALFVVSKCVASLFHVWCYGALHELMQYFILIALSALRLLLFLIPILYSVILLFALLELFL